MEAIALLLCDEGPLGPAFANEAIYRVVAMSPTGLVRLRQRCCETGLLDALVAKIRDKPAREIKVNGEIEVIENISRTNVRPVRTDLRNARSNPGGRKNGTFRIDCLFHENPSDHAIVRRTKSIGNCNSRKTSFNLRPVKLPLPKRVHLALRTRLLDGSLPPGTRLDYKQLSVELGVSTTPVREAVTQLAAEGSVELIPRLGAVGQIAHTQLSVGVLRSPRSSRG